MKKRNRGGSGNKRGQEVQGDAEPIIPNISPQNPFEPAQQQVNENNRNQRYPQQQQQQRQQKQQSQLGSLIQTAKEKAAAFGEREANGKSGVPGILHVPRSVLQNDASAKRGPKGQQQQQQKGNFLPTPALRPAKPRQTASAPPVLADPADGGLASGDLSQSARKRKPRRKRILGRTDVQKEKEAESGSSGDEKADAAATVIPSVMQKVHILPLVSPSQDSR